MGGERRGRDIAQEARATRVIVIPEGALNKSRFIKRFLNKFKTKRRKYRLASMPKDGYNQIIMMTLSQVKKNPQIAEFVNQSAISLTFEGYTDHGLSHLDLVADRARNIAKEIGLSQKEQELSAIAAFCHDTGNFLWRTNHHYFGALLFHQVFQNDFPAKALFFIMQAIANNDKKEMKFSNPVSAFWVLVDKSEVRRSRVLVKNIDKIKADIHDRVNYATTMSKLGVNKEKKVISLVLKIDTSFVPVIEYFEIFTERMAYCREAARYLGYKFGLVINNFKLL